MENNKAILEYRKNRSIKNKQVTLDGIESNINQVFEEKTPKAEELFDFD